MAAESKAKAAPQTVESVEIATPKKLIVCEVCGHGNPEGAGLCEMCSNYLFETGVKKNGNNQ